VGVEGFVIFERQTVRSTVEFAGLGLHTGVPVKVEVHPGDAGIWFSAGTERIEAIPANVIDTKRCTRLGPVSTIEHLMSALAGLEITDAEVVVTGGEMPALDGSAMGFFQPLSAAGLTGLGQSEIPALFTRIFHQEDHGLKLAVGKGSGHWRYIYDLGDRWPGQQSFEVAELPAGYGQEIAPARTLVLSEEIEPAKAAGLGRGLDESSVLIVGKVGYESAPRFIDEPARHKLLDLIGDLYLAGVPLRFLNVVAERSGHRANVEVAAMLKTALTRS
jgi:UDP-3-O-acyl-N-acetylglucosamine deacetylase